MVYGTMLWHGAVSRCGAEVAAQSRPRLTASHVPTYSVMSPRWAMLARRDVELHTLCNGKQAEGDGADEDEGDEDMTDGGARTPLSPAVQRTVAAIIVRLASRAQYSKVRSRGGLSSTSTSTVFLGSTRDHKRRWVVQ